MGIFLVSGGNNGRRFPDGGNIGGLDGEVE